MAPKAAGVVALTRSVLRTRSQRDDDGHHVGQRLGGPAMVPDQYLPGGLRAPAPAPDVLGGQAPGHRQRVAVEVAVLGLQERLPGQPVGDGPDHRRPGPLRNRSAGTVVGDQVPPVRPQLAAGRHPVTVAAQPDPRGVIGDPHEPQARQLDPAVPDRDVEFERNAAADRGRGRQAREMAEVRGQSLLQADQAVVRPAAQVRQAEQPLPGLLARGLNLRQQRVPGPEGGGPGRRGTGFALGRRRDGVQQHQVLAQLRVMQEPDRGRTSGPFGQCDERRFRQQMRGEQIGPPIGQGPAVARSWPGTNSTGYRFPSVAPGRGLSSAPGPTNPARRGDPQECPASRELASSGVSI